MMKEVCIGDLVRLRDDEEMIVGVGIILEKREDTYDIALNLLQDYNEHMSSKYGENNFKPEQLTSAEVELLKSPVYLVLWQSADDRSFSSKPIWMYDSEIEIVNAAARSKHSND